MKIPPTVVIELGIVYCVDLYHYQMICLHPFDRRPIGHTCAFYQSSLEALAVVDLFILTGPFNNSSAFRAEVRQVPSIH